jgi:hypothetical protein
MSLLRAVNDALSSLILLASNASDLWLSLASRPCGTSRAHQCHTSVLSLELCHSNVASLIFCGQPGPAPRVLECPCGVCIARKLSFTCDSSVTGPQQNQAEAPRPAHCTHSPFQKGLGTLPRDSVARRAFEGHKKTAAHRLQDFSSIPSTLPPSNFNSTQPQPPSSWLPCLWLPSSKHVFPSNLPSSSFTDTFRLLPSIIKCDIISHTPHHNNIVDIELEPSIHHHHPSSPCHVNLP